MPFRSDANPDDRGREGGFPHLSDPTAAHDAFAINYNNDDSGLSAEDVQAAIDEMVTSIETLPSHSPNPTHPYTDEANTFTAGPQTITPTVSQDGLAIEVPAAAEAAVRPLTIGTWTGGKSPALTEQFYVDYLGKAGFRTAQFGGTAGAPIGDAADNQTLARGTHEHAFPFFNPGGETFTNYGAYDQGAIFEDLGACTTDGIISFIIMQIPAFNGSGAAREISDISIRSGATAMSGCTHFVASLYRYTPGVLHLVAQTTDNPSETWAANTWKTISFTPSNVDPMYAVFVGLCISATTHPSLMGTRVPPALVGRHASTAFGVTTGLTDTMPSTETEDFTSSARFYVEASTA